MGLYWIILDFTGLMGIPSNDQHSYWKGPFVFCFPMKMVIFQSYVTVYQRVYSSSCLSSGSTTCSVSGFTIHACTTRIAYPVFRLYSTLLPTFSLLGHEQSVVNQTSKTRSTCQHSKPAITYGKSCINLPQ